MRFFALLLLLPSLSFAAEKPILDKAPDPARLSIAAVVNDNIVSTLDVDQRVRLILGTTGIKDSPEIRARLRNVALRALIDERLQIQEAANNGIAITKEDIAKATATIEEQRGKPIGSLREHLAANNLPVASFEQQITAQIAWQRLLQKKARPRIKISDSEIAQARDRLSSGGGAVSEVQLAVILLPVDAPANDENTRKLAEKLVGEIRSGASFDAVASQFAKTSPDAGSSEPFWAEPSQLDSAIAQKIAKLTPGQIAEPVRTTSGWQIVRLMDVRKKAALSASAQRADSEIALKEILLSLKPDAAQKEAELLLSVAKDVAKNPGSCTEQGVAGMNSDDAKALDIKVDFTRTRVSALPLPLQPIVSGLDVGAATEPFATPEGLKLLLLCERMDMPVDAPATPTAPLPKEESDTIRRTLFQQKMELESTKYIRNLRREAFLDIRMK